MNQLIQNCIFIFILYSLLACGMSFLPRCEVSRYTDHTYSQRTITFKHQVSAAETLPFLCVRLSSSFTVPIESKGLRMEICRQPSKRNCYQNLRFVHEYRTDTISHMLSA